LSLLTASLPIEEIEQLDRLHFSSHNAPATAEIILRERKGRACSAGSPTLPAPLCYDPSGILHRFLQNG